VGTHTLGVTLIPIAAILLLIDNHGRKILTSKFMFLLLLALSFVGFSFLDWKKVVDTIWGKLIGFNFLEKNFIRYYHSLFWRQYSLLVFLSLLAFIDFVLRKKVRVLLFFGVIVLVYMVAILFFVGVPFEKYALVLFPILFILSSAGLLRVAELMINKTKFQKALFFFLIVFVLANGNKFSLKPRGFYTLNFDMREIPEINYKSIYLEAKRKAVGVGLQKVAFVDIDADIIAWYLGEGVNGFIPRNDVEPYIKIDRNRNYKFIHNLEEFKRVKNEYPYGFIMLIEHNYRFYPEGLVEYVRGNLELEKRERFAFFSQDWNYWPIEFYSWGFD
jgi:hypothetical protein